MRTMLFMLIAVSLSGAQVSTGGKVTNTGKISVSPVIEPTPTMGWNPWQVFGASTTETEIRNNCAAMASNGMLAAGYNYCGFDDVWATTRVAGVITPTASYPTISTLCSYIHGLGEKCMGYLGPGATACNGQVSSQGFAAADVALLASWGVDYLKADTCTFGWTTDSVQAEFQDFRNAINASGRPMRYFVSVPPLFCSGSCDISTHWFYTVTGGNENWSENDIAVPGCGPIAQAMTFNDLKTAVDSQFGLASYGGPNHYLFPGIYLGVGNGCLTDTEGQSDFSLMSILAAPLIASIDLTAPPSSATMTTLLNSDVIAVDQDPLGVIGSRVSSVSCGSGLCEVYAKQLSGGAWAVVLWNRDSASHSISATWSMFGQTGPYTNTRDLWAHTSLGTLATGYTTTVVAHGVSMIRVAP